ncbi:zinc finger and BTB domain-containing protein 38 [Engystomops pustulosus]|uniref:zinc finger and BTB domain-containing protein 38 n=1 Tax=Engystomops pustulosus TaxID=76066 RepID=UPI003AFA5038
MCTSEDLADSLHGETLLCNLNEQRMQGFLCDVTIVVEDTKFKAHRNILAASSLYFRNQFRSQSILIQGHVLELTDFKADTFTEILNFIYSSKIAVKKRETLTDLADAGKKLGITFLENIKTSKKCSAITCSTENEGTLPPAFYRGENLKSETVDKKGDDPAVASGPRITNAFSILETEVNGFSPLDLRANFKKTNGSCEEDSNKNNCDNGVCSDGEPVNTLAEHSYAVSPGDAPYKRDSVFDHSTKISPLRDGESTTPCTVSKIQDPVSSSGNMPVLEPQCFMPQTIAQSSSATNNVTRSTDQTANPSDFYSQKENESLLLPLPPSNPPAPPSFCENALYPLPKRPHETLSCKNCSKEFAHFKRLQRHEQICFKVVHTEKDMRLPNSLSQVTSTDGVSDQNGLGNSSSAATDHFVKIVDGKIFYVCIVCKRNYVTLSSLRRHSNVHSWRKSYPCHYCSKIFALAEYRTKHEIWHTGDRRYQCIFCLETFMTYYILKNHQKSSHGIDPRLGVGSKANNRGLKSSIYPYKLYRLLPMKSKRAALNSSANDSTEQSGIHFQGQNSFNMTTVVQNPMISQPFALENQESFSCTIDTTSQNAPTTNQDAWPFNIIQCDKNANVLSAVNSSTPNKVLDSASKEGEDDACSSYTDNQNIPSVINTTKSAPSVIMHSSRVSSVIMHGNAVTGGTTTNGVGWNHSRTIVSPEREDMYQGNNVETMLSTTTSEEEHSEKSRAEESHQDRRDYLQPATSYKKNKSVIREGNKTETYIAKPALPGTLVNSGIAPLCQITVKIGSEALVKRQISGSSLFFRKNGRPRHSESKPEKSRRDSDEDKKERSSNRLRKSESVQMEEMCDDGSDQDVSDKPWRPYYNYKPKKKSKHFKKFRKLKKKKKHSRSRPAEEEIGEVNVDVEEVDTKYSSGEAEDQDDQQEKPLEIEDFKDHEKTDGVEMATAQWQLDSKPFFCELCQKSFRNPSTLKVHMRCHTGEKPYPCKTCGKCFSFPGNLNKHERIHQTVKNFTCQYCSKSFMLQEILKKHERIHTREKTYDCQFCSQQFLYLCTKKNHEQKHLAEQNVKGYVCFHCSKVCKTAAALGMHQKKHYLKGLKHRERKDFPPSTGEIGSWSNVASSTNNKSNLVGERSSLNVPESFSSSYDDCEAPLLSFNNSVTEVIPQNVNAASLVENVNEIGESDSHFMSPAPPPPTGLNSNVLMEASRGWKHWKTRQYNLEESMNSDHSSLKENTKTFTELKTMTSFETPFVP